MKQKISAVISAYNEEQVIKDCLESLSWVDEIILIDNESQDKTVSIAKIFKAKIFSQPNNPLILNKNKNFGFSKTHSLTIADMPPSPNLYSPLKKP